VRTIALNEVTIAANRQRREFDQTSINELAESISGPAGLLHAPILRMEFDLAVAGKTRYVLVAGERRLRALEAIFALGGQFLHDGQTFSAAEGLIPFTLTADLSSLEREEAEYDENTRRADLTWQERAAATARLADLRIRQAAAKGEPPPGVTSLAQELGRDTIATRDTTRKELLVAPHLSNPLVAAAKSTDEAFKILRREESNQRHAELAAAVGKTFTSSAHTALNEDALDWLTKSIDQFDVILTDPPYGMGADEFGDAGGVGGIKGSHTYRDDTASFTRILSICSTELFRLAKAQAHLYWFCDIDQFHAAREAFAAGGWWVHRTPIIWHKPTASRLPWPEHGPQRKWEMILYAVKGKRHTKRIAPDLVVYSPDAQLNHPAQKPVNLFLDLLARSTNAGDSVLDPFCGIGATLRAAKDLGRKAIGIEIEEKYCEIAVRRLAQKVLPL